MGSIKERVEESNLALQYCLGCKRLADKLKHIGIVCHYVKLFYLFFMLNMPKENKLFNFMSRL